MEKSQKPTPRQRKAAKAVTDNLISDKTRPLSEVLSSVGYGIGLQTQPSRVLESQGFKKALYELGLTEELITSSLVSDINSKESRLGELKLGAEILGMTKREEEPQKNQGGNTYNFIFSAETQADVKEIEDRIKARIVQKHEPT